MARNGRKWFFHSVAVGMGVNAACYSTLWVGSWVLWGRTWVFAFCFLLGRAAHAGFLH